jgi:hypothetical protein
MTVLRVLGVGVYDVEDVLSMSIRDRLRMRRRSRGVIGVIT